MRAFILEQFPWDALFLHYFLSSLFLPPSALPLTSPSPLFHFLLSSPLTLTNPNPKIFFPQTSQPRHPISNLPFLSIFLSITPNQNPKISKYFQIRGGLEEQGGGTQADLDLREKTEKKHKIRSIPNDDDAATGRWKETKEGDMRYQRERKEEIRERDDKFWGSLRRIISAGFRGKTVLELGKKWNSTLFPKKNTRSIMMLQKNEDRTKDEYRIWNRFRSKWVAVVLGGVDNRWILMKRVELL